MTETETLPILLVPDKRLRLKARPLGAADGDAIRALAPKMLATMYAAPGIGLAAPQIGGRLAKGCAWSCSISSPRKSPSPWCW